MATHAEDVLLSLLDDVDGVEVWARENPPIECIPTEEIRPVVQWCVDYYFRSGKMKAPSKEAIRSTWGQVLDDAQVSLGDGTETDDMEWVIDDLKSAYAQTQATNFTKSLANDIYAASNPEKVEVIKEAAYSLTTLALELASKADSVEFKSGVTDIIHDYEARALAGNVVQGITFGLPEIDNFIGGIHPGEVCVIAAGPKVGKSYFLARIAWQMFLAGKTVVLFTLENSVTMTMDRMLCMHLGISPDRWRRGECTAAEIEYLRIFRDEQMPALPGTLHIIQPDLGNDTMQAMVRQAETLGADALLIDQLTFVSHPNPGRKSRSEVIRELMHELKGLVKNGRHKMPCILAHQINREGVKQARKDGWLTMEMLAEGSEVERTADFVFGLYQSNEDRQVFMSKMQMLATRRTDYKSWSMLWNINDGVIAVIGEVTPTS